MTASIDFKDIERRPVTYWHVDGLPELVMGLLWMVWGGAWLFGQTLPRGAAWNVYWMFVPALLALSGVAAVRITKELKARVTFPRTGYVAWKEPTRAQRLTAAAFAILTAMAMVVLLVQSRAAGLERVAAPGLGVLLCLGFVTASITQKAPHLLALGAVAIALGLAFTALWDGWEAMHWMFVALGAATALVGAGRLMWFVRRHPVEAGR